MVYGLIRKWRAVQIREFAIHDYMNNIRFLNVSGIVYSTHSVYNMAEF